MIDQCVCDEYKHTRGEAAVSLAAAPVLRRSKALDPERTEAAAAAENSPAMSDTLEPKSFTTVSMNRTPSVE